MHIVIIGNGITGITAAITIRRLSADHQITVVSSESEHFLCPNRADVPVHGA